jgi:tetratricopeptide (TPR) repeat protein
VLIVLAGIWYATPQKKGSDPEVIRASLLEEERKADGMVANGESASAEQLYNKLEPRIQSEFGKASPERAEILFKLAKVQLINGQVGPATDSFMVLAMMMKKDPSVFKLDEPLSMFVFKMGKEHHFDKGNFDGASAIFKGAMLIETESPTSSKARVSELTTWFARSLYPEGDNDRAAKFFRNAIKMASHPETAEEKKAKAFAQAEYTRMILTHPSMAEDRKQLDKAKQMSEESLRWRTKINDQAGIEESKGLIEDVKKKYKELDD